ncbi:MAG: phage head closure protein [Planctomycetaceae bacterium]
MEIGKLKNRITIEKYTESRSNAGQVLKSYTTSSTRWAMIKPLTTREILQAQQVHAEITHEIYLRYPLDVTAKDRIKYDNRTFEILGVINVDEAKFFLRLNCVERA